MTKKTLLTFAFLVLTGSLTTLYGSQMPNKQKNNTKAYLLQIIATLNVTLKNKSTPFTVKEAEDFWNENFSYLYKSECHHLCFQVCAILNKKTSEAAKKSQERTSLTILTNTLLCKHTFGNCTQCNPDKIIQEGNVSE